MYVYLYYLYVLLVKTKSVTEKDGNFLRHIKNYYDI